MAAYLGPGQRWPKHSRPEARAALREAAAAGWHLRKSDGHIFGTIKCPAMGQPGECTKSVFSTSGSADGADTARAIRKALRNCPHRDSGEVDVVSEDEGLADPAIERMVRRLIAAADGLQRRSLATVELERAIDRDDVAAFDESSQRVVGADNDAQIALTELGRPVDPWPPEVGRQELLDEVERLISRVDDADLARRLIVTVHRPD